jgi:hypothetical protein
VSRSVKLDTVARTIARTGHKRKIRATGTIKSPLSQGAPMRAWIRRMIRRHLIADDPHPEHSRLDNLDGLPPERFEPGQGPNDRDDREERG